MVCFYIQYLYMYMYMYMYVENNEMSWEIV